MRSSTATTLGELLDASGGDIKTGPFGTKLKAAEYTLTGVPVISVGEVGYGRLRLHEKTPRVDASVTNRMPEYLLRYGDIVFGRKGAVDRSARVQIDQDGWFLGSDGIRVRLPTSCDSAFIAYQLQTPAHRDWMIQHAAGSTMPSLNEGIIRRIPIVFPPLDEQRSIAAVLGSLDDKIEQNRRTGRKLEELARAVFKAWFVDFEPVKAKAAGASGFPGMPPEAFDALPERFVDSELGPVPDGWDVKPIGDEFDFQVGFAFKSAQFTDDPSHVRLVRGDNVKEGAVEWGSKTRRWGEVTENISRYHLAAGDVVVGMDGSKLGKNWSRISAVDLPCLLVQRVTRFRANGAAGQGLLWLLISDPKFRDFIDAVKTGTSIPHVSGGQLRSFPFVKPGDDRILGVFEDLVGPLLIMADHLKAESAKLATLRDYLLPKLLSRRVRVKDAEREIGGVS